MAKSGRLKEIADERAEALESLIPRLLIELGSPYLVAVHLGVYPYTIRRWLLNNGYKVIEGSWQKTGEATNEPA